MPARKKKRKTEHRLVSIYEKAGRHNIDLKKIAKDAPNKKVQKFIENLDKMVALLFNGPDGRPLRLTDYQRHYIARALTRKPGKFLFVACTRAGKSTATAVLAILFGILYPMEEIVVVAPTMRQTQIVFGKMRDFILGSPILEKMIDKDRSFRHDLIHFKNGTVLRALSASTESVLGFGASVLIVDEASSIPDEVFTTRILRMIMSPRVRERKPVLILLGTPHHMNYMYRLWIDPSPEIYRVRVTWRDAVKAGIMKKEEVEFARKYMNETDFRIWFEAEFTNPEGQFFDMTALRECAVGDPSIRGEKKTRLPGWKRVMGVDVARLGSDQSAVVVIDFSPDFSLETGTAEVVAVYVRSKMYINEVIGWVYNLALEWNPDYIAVDSIGMGVGVVDVLREKLGGVVVDVAAAGRERVEMFTTFRRLVNERRIILPAREEVIQQFQSYQIKYRSDGSIVIHKTPGMRDDIADAIIYATYVGVKRHGHRFYVFEDAEKYLDTILRPEWLRKK